MCVCVSMRVRVKFAGVYVFGFFPVVTLENEFGVYMFGFCPVAKQIC